MICMLYPLLRIYRLFKDRPPSNTSLLFQHRPLKLLGFTVDGIKQSMDCHDTAAGILCSYPFLRITGDCLQKLSRFQCR